MTNPDREERIQRLIEYSNLDEIKKERKRVKQDVMMLNRQAMGRLDYLWLIDDAIAQKELNEETS